jgi:excisionase family DNA binding protein
MSKQHTIPITENSPNKPKEDSMLTPPQVAARLGCTDDTVRAIIRRGELPALMIGKRFKVKAADVDAYLARAQIGLHNA